MEWVEAVNSKVNAFVWGPVMLCVFLGAGLLFTVGSGFFQVRGLRTWWRVTFCSLFQKGKEKQQGKTITQFQALSTALAAALGTGNIVGVATAITMGGPGAVFWMWISTFFGMMTSFAENALGIQYRYRSEDGEYVGGPMVYLERGLHAKPLAVLFAVFCTLASFGIGNMTQGNSAAGALHDTFGISPVASGAVMCVVFLIVSYGGISRIAGVTEKLVPFIAVGYLAAGLTVIAVNYRQILPAFSAIFTQAFDWRSAAGGIMGGVMLRSVRFGVARGVFSNEAGMGSSVIAHCAAENGNAAEQGMWGMFEVFVDTLVMCTVTALVLLTSGVPLDASQDASALSARAFSTVFGGLGGKFVAVSIALFAFATLIGWSYYGERSVAYLFGSKAVKPYKWIFTGVILLGCIMKLTVVWDISDTFNGLMSIPNLIALFGLARQVFPILKAYCVDSRARRVR